MNIAIVGLGSNIDPENNIAKARKILATEQVLLKESSFLRTSPIDRPEQNSFINGVCMVQTSLNQQQFEEWLKDIEKGLGRVRNQDKFAPRTIDLDIVVWNSRIVDRDLYTREFLKKAVLEVMPELPL